MKILLLTISFLICVISVSANDGYKRNPNVDIIYYSFSVSISDSSDIIHGHSVITINFNGSVKSFDLDLINKNAEGKGMTLHNVSFDRFPVTWVHTGNKIIITLAEPVTSGSGILSVDYSGIPADGLIISNNKFGKRTFFADHWPDRGRNWLPCVDHPYDKATVDFIVSAPIRYKVVGSGRLVEESNISDITKLTHWKEEVPLAVKVMAIGGAEFATQYAGSVDGIPVWTWVFSENRTEGFDDYSVALRPLEFYTRLLGQYPYEKLANVQSKTIFGGLENAGCIFYSENSVTGKGKAEDLIAHEIAHQWFGNSVTENDWHHVWLSEGFATYLTSVYREKIYGQEELVESMKKARDRVIKFYIKSPGPVLDTTVTDLMKLLNANSYQKGAWVLHMLRTETGDEQFWKGLRTYYEKYRNMNAVTADFQKVMEEASGKDLAGFFNQWLMISGQPDLKISTRKAGKGKTEIIIEQTQKYVFTFDIDLQIRDSEGNRTIKIPVSEKVTRKTVKTEKFIEIIPDPDVKLLFRNMADKKMTFPVKS
jgi:aminopeptidase N